jgi:NAD-dependent deacetylase
VSGTAALEQVHAWVAGAQHIAVLTGAGMSAESGIATFRDALTGLWSRFDPAQLASVEGFEADPATVWRWYAERREGVRRAEPNAGHVALAEFARRRPGVLTLVSQNVDDLHQRAGNVDTIRLHGDILRDEWLRPCAKRPFDAAQDRPTCAVTQAVDGTPPRCADCGNLVRPGVVWFGEMLPPAAIDAAERAATECDLMLIVGTSGAVWPAAGLAEVARRAGAQVVIVNPSPSEIDDTAHLLLRGTAADVLPVLLRP